MSVLLNHSFQVNCVYHFAILPIMGAEIGFEPIIFEVTQYLGYQIAEGAGLEPAIYNIYNKINILTRLPFRHPSRVQYYIPL